MTPTVAEILESDRGLSPDDRAVLAHERLVSIGEDDVEEATKLEALRAAVAPTENSIDEGKGSRIPLNELREHIRRIGHEATERARQVT